MRDILFRGKSERSGEWVYGSLIVTHGGCVVYSKYHPLVTALPEKKGDYLNQYVVDPRTVGQYTGLTDWKGKKVFEGDIIKIFPDCDYLDDYDISKVYSYNGIFCVDYHGYDFDSTALGFLESYIPDGAFEIIGNIHDNPELLEVRE